MGKYIWLVILALPVWAAVELDAPKWVTEVPHFAPDFWVCEPVSA